MKHPVKDLGGNANIYTIPDIPSEFGSFQEAWACGDVGGGPRE